MEHLDRSISTNSNNTIAFNLKSAILRKTYNPELALGICSGIMSRDPLDVWSMYEKYLAVRKQLCARIPEELFDAQSLITPSCGIRFADRDGSLAIMGAAAEISRRIRSKHF